MGFNAHAQSPEINFNSATVIKKGAEYYDQKKYKEAIAEYLKVPRNDTNYVDVLRDLTLAYYSDSNYTASKNVAMQGLKYYPEKADDWYNLIANSFDKMGDQKTGNCLL